MRQKPFPEKTEEMLFTRYFLQACGLGNGTLYAPSSVEERVLGYDAKLFGAQSFREIFVQFKAPIYKQREDLFRIDITSHQHKILKHTYRPRSAFYVTHTFRSLEELHEVESTMKNALDFLLHFIAIEISGLSDDLRFFTYKKPTLYSVLPDIKYGESRDKGKHEGATLLAEDHWFWGSRLLRDFRKDRIGAKVQLIPDDTPQAPLTPSRISETSCEVQPAEVWRVNSTVMRQIMEGEHDRDWNFGVTYRKDLSGSSA